MVHGIWVSLLAVLIATGAKAQERSFAEMATQHFKAGQYDQLYQQASDVWAARGGQDDEAGVAAAALGAVCAVRGDFEGAETWYDRAETAFAAAKDDARLARLDLALAVVRFLDSRKYGEGAPDDALKCIGHAKARGTIDENEVRCVEAVLLGRSSKALHVQDAYLGYMQLIQHYQAAGDSLNTSHCVFRLARIDGSTGGHRSALAGSLRAAHIFREAGDEEMLGWALRNAGHAQRKLGQYAASESLLKDALVASPEDRVLAVWVYNDLSRLYAEAGDDEAAIEADRKAAEGVAEIMRDLEAGRLTDTVQIDFFELLKLRYASLLPYAAHLDYGFLDQLMVWQ